MPIRVDAYTAGGMASGVLARAGHLRDALETDDVARPRTGHLAGARRARPAPGRRRWRSRSTTSLVAVADDDPSDPGPRPWHPIHLEAGPYRLDGELPTMPGFDPGRALTRPTGEFVLLRDVRMLASDDPGVRA